MSHQQPTQEELDAGIKASIEKEEQFRENPDAPEDTEIDPPKEEVDPNEDQDESEEDTDPEKESDEKVEDDDGEDEPEKEEDKPKEEKKVKPPVKEAKPNGEKRDLDYKTMHHESSREAMVLHAKNKKIQEAITNAADLPAPTDEEMETKFSNWEDMTSTEQSLARDVEHLRRQNQAINSAAQEGKNIDEWNTQVDSFLEDPHSLIDNPELEGKQDDFKIFAMKPTRRGLDFEDLVLAFNGERAKTVKPKQKGKMFETGNGGPKDKGKEENQKLTLAESVKLRDADYKEFQRQLAAGNIEQY